MKKLIAITLVLVCVLCCVGCTPETPEHTDPSGTLSTEPTDPTGTGATVGPDDPTDADGPEMVQYTWKQTASYLNDYMCYVGTYRSLEELQNSDYREWKSVEKYDEDFFENNTLIIVSIQATPPCGHRVTDLVRNEDGSYLLNVEHLWYGAGRDMVFGTSVVIEVNELIPADAEVILEVTSTIVSAEDSPHEDILE